VQHKLEPTQGLNGVFCFWHDNPQWASTPSFTIILDHTQRLTTVGVLCKSDQFVAKTSTRQHTIITINIDGPGGIRTHNLSRRTAVDLSLRTRGNLDRTGKVLVLIKMI